MDLIHVLAFDFSGQPGDSVELADWVKAELLPVIEDVLDEQRAPGHRRIERLVLDLGTVTAEDAGSELPRRLREQLALALAAAPSEAGGAAPGERSDLLAFLRTGAMPWRAGPADHAAHTALLRQVLAAQDAPAVLDTVLREPHMLTRLIRQFDTEALCAAADVLFSAWPATQRAGALAWAVGEAGRLPQGGPAMEAFWRWLLAQRAQPGDAGALSLRRQLRVGGSFSLEAMRCIERGLASAEVALLAPYWGRILASAPQCLRASHPHLMERWLRDADDAMLADLLGVVQADCAWLLARLAISVPQARLAAMLRPAMAQWLALPVDTLAPHVVLAWVRAVQPDSSSQFALSGPVDSTHFRAPLRVLGSLFARAEIITISKALNAGAFALLAPYWDRLLVLAPHWLRSEYPRLARTWAAGFETEVLIDILSVVQAECCAPIEQLAGTLPREQLHAALRPFLPGWFDAGVDALPPHAILDAVQWANPAWLEEVLLRADMVHLQRMWPAVVMAQRAPFRRIWAQLPAGNRERASARVLAELPVDRQVDVAVILQPAVARMMAERAASGASLDSALPFLLRADVASVVPDQLLDCWPEERGPEPVFQEAPATLDAAIAAAQVSEEALRAFVAACQQDDPQLGQLNSAQLHALVRAWARCRRAEDFLDAIEAGALRAAAPHAYFRQVLQQVLAGAAIDLDTIGTLCARDAAFAAAQRSAPALRAYVAACQREDAQFGQFSAHQLHALVRAWAGFQHADDLLDAVEAGALQAAAPHAYFGKVLRQALAGVVIDLGEGDVAPVSLPAPQTPDAAVAAAQWSASALRAFVAACQRDDAQFAQLSADQLHALVRAWAAFPDAGLDLADIEAGAMRAASPHAHFGGVLRHALTGASALLPAPARFAAAHMSEPAWRDYVAACQRDDAQFGQLSAEQLHALVRAWAGFRHADDLLDAVEAGALQAAAPHAYFGKVLRQALAGMVIDLDEVDAGAPALLPAPVSFAAAQLSASALRNYVAACQSDDAQLAQLSADQLHALVRAWAGFQDAGAPLPAIEAAAQLASAPHAFFRNILQQAMRGVPIDVDAIAVPAPRADADTAAAGSDSPVPSMLLQALPRRLADALLRADLTSVEAIWPEIVRYHPDLLAQAAQRYLGRADARERLLGAVDAAKMHDLLGCVSAPAGRLVAPLVDGAARFAILLPAPLSPDAFQQRILRCAFAQAMARTAPAGWVEELLRAVMPGQSEAARLPVAHAWHELLRGSGTPLESALDDVLHGRAYVDVALARVGAASTLPEPLQYMLTEALCHRNPALTDELLAHGRLTGADPAAFSVAEWQDLARAQLPRQPRAAQQAFWRAFAAYRGANAQTMQAAFAAAFAVLAQPAADAATVDAAPAAAAMPQGGAATLAMLLMRASPPDAATSAAITLLAQRLLFDAAGHAALRSALAEAQAVERLTAILPGPTLARLLCMLQPTLAGALPAVLRAVAGTLSISVSAVPATLDNATWRTIYAAVFTGPVPTSARALAARLAGTAPLLDEPPAPGDPMAQLLQPLAAAPPARATVRSADEPVPFNGDANLRNAGLVLIAPYIERLFALLDITRDGDFISDETRQRGVHLLQYAVTAEEATPEYLLVLNKLLCGIPAAVPVASGITMSDREKETIEQLLGSVVAHWSALGSSTVAALRETFMQRDGALYLEEDAWRLKIPQRTFDMLLDRLPWSYKLIKFSWMAAPLNVTWR